jgi:hypothetical protein
MIFPYIETEEVVQIGDRTRLDASKTYASKGLLTITKVEIEPETGAGFIDVTGSKASDWLTDWEYLTAGTKTITIKVTDSDTPTPSEYTRTGTIEVLTEADDALWSTDGDLVAEEPDVLKYVRRGRNTFKDIHREAQRQILQLLDRKGYRIQGRKIVAADLVDKSEAAEMSKYLALYMIMAGQRSQTDDVYQAKADKYMSKYQIASQRQIIGIDLDGDGTVSEGEGVNIATAKLVRR